MNKSTLSDQHRPADYNTFYVTIEPSVQTATNRLHAYAFPSLNYVDDYIFLKFPSDATVFENVLENNSNHRYNINNNS